MSETKKRSVPVVSVESDPSEPDFFGLDEETLDENMHYRFCHNSQQRMASLYAKGYRPVKRSDGVRLITDHEQGAAEDLIKVGDTVLMACRKEVRERRIEKQQRLTEARLETPESQFRRKAQAANVKVSEKLMKGEET